ncbi:MAG: hypothetical protein J0H59_06175 [Comamonadaceae bacterium]|nr:hypothetical protein [Comamonadaceae bacterium]
MSEKRYGSTARTAGRRTIAMAQEETITLSGGGGGCCCSWCLKEKGWKSGSFSGMVLNSTPYGRWYFIIEGMRHDHSGPWKYHFTV